MMLVLPVLLHIDGCPNMILTETISKNLVSIDTHRGSYHRATIRSGSCPNCGEAEPH